MFVPSAFSMVWGLSGDLEPDDSAFETDLYLELARDVLLAGHLERDCQMIALPSFRTEYAVFIAPKGSGSVVVLRQAPIWLVYTEDGASGHQSGDSSRLLKRLNHLVREYSVPVGKEAVELLRNAWGSMLDNVTSQPNNLGPDGDTYHFAQGHRAGKAYSPWKSSPCGRLVAAADAMKELAADGRPGRDRELVVRATELLTERSRQLTCR